MAGRHTHERSRSGAQKAKPPVVTLSAEQLKALLDRTRATVSEADFKLISGGLETLAFLTEELHAQGASLKRLRRFLFGSTSETSDKILGKDQDDSPTDTDSGKADRPKAPGHGKNGAAAYTGAARVAVPHPTMHAGDGCPGCEKGKVYPLPEPGPLVRIIGVAPLSATVYECDRLRCNLCGEVFAAPPPPGVGDEKYDESAVAMVGLLKYGAGQPFNRIEKLQQNMGIPLPASTQWELVEEGADKMAPAQEELIRQAAQGDVVHNDDTAMKILEVTAEERAEILGETDRTGTFTSGIVSVGQGRSIALFFTGVEHAGENLEDVLARRAKGLPKPIQMCDALAANSDGDFETILAACLTHARRHFVDEVEDFPNECRVVLEALKAVYRTDAKAKVEKLSSADRLRFHQKESGPVMGKLKKWAKDQLREKKVEPNSGLGQALTYLLKHWRKLTQFLKVPGAPLDNNICERILKKAILHRKNALFYKTLNGARVGDTFMSLIHTAELNGAEPFDYLASLLRHEKAVSQNPGAWMPWNYRATRDILPAV
jgi:transposase